MPTIVTASAGSSAEPSAFFARWTDHASWTDWDPDLAWVHLDGPVAEGTTGRLKPTGGPRVRFTITTLRPDREYTDTSRLFGARLVFQHLAEPTAAGTTLEVRVSMSGPLAPVWARILGGGFRTSAPAGLQRLVELVERDSAA